MLASPAFVKNKACCGGAIEYEKHRQDGQVIGQPVKWNNQDADQGPEETQLVEESERTGAVSENFTVDMAPRRKEAILVFLENIRTMGAKTVPEHEKHRKIDKPEVNQSP